MMPSEQALAWFRERTPECASCHMFQTFTCSREQRDTCEAFRTASMAIERFIKTTRGEIGE